MTERDEWGCSDVGEGEPWRQFSVSLPQKAVNALDQLAKAEGISRAEYVRRLIRARLTGMVD